MYGVWKPRQVIAACARWLKARLRNCLRWVIRLVKPLGGQKRVSKIFAWQIKMGMIFEELGIKFFGPFDGHDLPLLLDVFENIKHVEGPVIVQVVTKKGKG